jgi:hypothetical protein
MRWVWHIAHKGGMRVAYKIIVGKPERKRPLRRPRHRWGMIFKWILRKQGDRVMTGFIWLRL